MKESSDSRRSTDGPAAPARPSVGVPTIRSHAVWKGGLLFEAGIGERLQQIDGNSKVAPSPVETLLSSIGTCAGADVADILTKQRTPPDRLEIEIFATRRPEHPRRLVTVELTFQVDGPKIDPPQAERAIALSIEKYCTVAATLAGDIQLTSILVLNGSRGDPVRQPMFSATVPSR
ncbi:MAG TPA: OsmC family protein [Gemmatimonadaceae bacterium]|nr:OsmC family protein [Gemmatimonadaceae bacterium]